jgi:peptidoglycan/LPS O-acetylase OafA/YrhL
VRGLAALSVIAFHVGLSVNAVDHGVIAILLRGLQLRFEVFFILSGFLLYRPILAARATGRPPRPLRRYARARVLRIVPAFWLALIVLSVWPGLVGMRAATAPLFYGFAQTYSHATIYGGIVPAWSLCVEVAFYVLLPAYAALLQLRPASGGARRLLGQELPPLAALLVMSLVVRGFAPRDPLVSYSLLTWLDAYALGMGLAVLSVAATQMSSEPSALRAIGRRPGLCWLLAAGPFVVGAVLEQANRSPLTVHLLYELAALGFLLPACFGDHLGGLPRRVLALRPLAVLGTISYGLYIWHWSVLWYLREHGGTTWLPGSHYLSLLLATLVVTTAIATASYVLVERPLLRRKRPARRVPTLPAPAAATS